MPMTSGGVYSDPSNDPIYGGQPSPGVPANDAVPHFDIDVAVDVAKRIASAVSRAADYERLIWVSFQREGIHRYPRAAEDPALADVSFLASPHRHIFHFKVAVSVVHDDRDIEFIQFKRCLESMYGFGQLQLDYKSCEMIAIELIEEINKRYPQRYVMVDVSEDNENGAVISKDFR